MSATPPREPRILPFLLTGAVIGAIVLVAISMTAPDASDYTAGTISGFIVLLGTLLGALAGGLVAAIISAKNTRARAAIERADSDNDTSE